MSNHEQPITFTPRARRLAVGTLIAAAVIGGGAVAKHEYDQHNRSEHAVRMDAFKGTDRLLNNVFEIKSGANVRTTPEMLNGRPDTGEPNNIDRQIPDGKSWVVRLPEMKKGDSGWIAFSAPDTDLKSIKSVNQRVDHTVWVNYFELQRQGFIEETGYQPVTSDGEVPYKHGVNPLIANPGDSSYAASIEVDPTSMGIAGFIVTGEMPK